MGGLKIAAAIIFIIGTTMLLSLLFYGIGGDKFRRFGTIIGVLLGWYIYAKLITPRICSYFMKKRKIPIGQDCTTKYVFDKSGITAMELGRKTVIEWSAISAVEQTKNYIGLLCFGLFYYLPREKIGDSDAQKAFIAQCRKWMTDAKNK